MDQNSFSAAVKDYMQKHHPEFIQDMHQEPDGAIELRVRSPHSPFGMRVGSYFSEITYGFISPDGETDIHSHIRCDEEEDFPIAMEHLSEWILSVKTNDTLIYLMESGRWDWICRSDLASRELKKGKVYQTYSWTSNWDRSGPTGSHSQQNQEERLQPARPNVQMPVTRNRDILWVLIIPCLFLIDLYRSSKYSPFWFWFVLTTSILLIAVVLVQLFKSRAFIKDGEQTNDTQS